MNWSAAHKIISQAERIVLTSHERPDGDGLGSAGAMYHILKSFGKECKILHSTAIPDEYQFLNAGGIFEKYIPKKHRFWVEKTDLVMIFDVGDIRRLRSLLDDIQNFAIPTMNIDHHPHPEDHQFTYNFVDTQAAATGEMIYEYLQDIQVNPIPREVYEGIYTAVMTDTGSFRYNNTNVRSHEIAIACLQAGIDTTRIYQQVYECNRSSRMTLLGYILQNIHYEKDGELAWFSIDQEVLSKTGASRGDVDGFTDTVRTIEGVEVAIMIFEHRPQKCRVNFRSKGKYVVNSVAKSLGGGGHALAAGAVVDGSLDEVISRVLQLTGESFSKQEN